MAGAGAFPGEGGDRAMQTSCKRAGQRLGKPHRILAYCHDSVGLGHLRRTLTICERLGQTFPQTSFLLATGTPYFPMFSPSAAVDYIKLPALAKRDDGTYCSKYLGIPLEQLLRCRESLLLQAAESFEPHVVLVDKAPLGVCRELVPTLRWLRRERPQVRVVFGMRDIEDAPQATIKQWARNGASELIEEVYDEVWVYGMQRVFDVGAKYRLSPRIRAKLRYMGYIHRPPCNHPRAADRNGREILVTVGGGTDGEHVIDTYLADAAGRVTSLGVRSTVVGGPDLPPAAVARLRDTAARIGGVEWVDFEGCMSCRMQRSELVVSMGGYNTLCELAAHRKPALVIPRNHPRLEQTIRARLWEKRQAVRVLPREALTPPTLTERLFEMLAHEPKMTTPELDFSGLDRIVARFRTFWSQEADHAVAVRL
jgi:predicted glycosyltransferase